MTFPTCTDILQTLEDNLRIVALMDSAQALHHLKQACYY